MFSLDRHIEILLLSNDCVIVPGFGGFVTHHVCAHLDEDDRTMLPPKTMVGFNQQLTMNDSLLVQSYVETYDYSYPEALRIVNEEVDQLRSMIHDYGHFDIHSVGRLTVNRNGNYEFEPASTGILSPRLYGLSGVATTDSKAFISLKEADEDRRIAHYNGYSEGGNDRDFIRISTAALRRGMVACIVILLLMAVPLMNRTVNTGRLMSGIDTSLITDLMSRGDNPTETAASKATCSAPAAEIAQTEGTVTEEQPSTAADTKEVVADVNTVQETPQEQTLTETKKMFTVVLAARISQKNAEIYVAELQKRGMAKARVIGEGNGRKVVYGAFDNREEAQTVKKELAVDSEFEFAWVTEL